MCVRPGSRVCEGTLLVLPYNLDGSLPKSELIWKRANEQNSKWGRVRNRRKRGGASQAASVLRYHKAFTKVMKAPGAVLEVMIFKPAGLYGMQNGGCPCFDCCSSGPLIMGGPEAEKPPPLLTPVGAVFTSL